MGREREAGYLFAGAFRVIGCVGCIRLGKGGKANEVASVPLRPPNQNPAKDSKAGVDVPTTAEPVTYEEARQSSDISVANRFNRMEQVLNCAHKTKREDWLRLRGDE